MRFTSTYLAAIGMILATTGATNAVNLPSVKEHISIFRRQASVIKSSLSCGAFGPLEGEWGVIINVCMPGETYTCWATDDMGCGPGDVSKITSLVVNNPVNSQPLGGSASVSSASFTCPDQGLASCQLVLNEADAASNFGLSISAGPGVPPNPPTNNSTCP